MQLISAILFLFSLILLGGALFFARVWRRAHSKTQLLYSIRDGIGNIGISSIVEYPTTMEPIIALLDEEYPRSEVIVVTDLQAENSPLAHLTRKFQLVGVNHSHLKGVKGLYRSRHRAFRRMVLIDMPSKFHHLACDAAKAIASYDYALRFENESVIQSGAVAYCANIVATYSHIDNISLSTIVGAKARLERCDREYMSERKSLLTGRILAWRKPSLAYPLIAAAMPAIVLLAAHATTDRLLLVTAATIALALMALIYISCCIVFEKSLFSTLSTIIESFYRFMVEKGRALSRLYARRTKEETLSQPIIAINIKRTKREGYDREAN